MSSKSVKWPYWTIIGHLREFRGDNTFYIGTDLKHTETAVRPTIRPFQSRNLHVARVRNEFKDVAKAIDIAGSIG